MGKYAARITLNRSPEEVFAFVADQRNHARLNPRNFRNYRVLTPQSLGKGTQSEFVLQTGALHERVRITTTRYEAPSFFVQEGAIGDRGFRALWRVKPGEAGGATSILELVTEYEDQRMDFFVGGTIRAGFERIYGRLLRDIRTELEGRNNTTR